jgi:flagellar basal-body rod modification protein FlgD
MEIQNISSRRDDISKLTGQAGGTLGKDEFMKMLVAQMKNQDPTKPMDNSQMTAQLAQFSALEQMQNLNTRFESMQQSTTAAVSLMNSGSLVELELTDGSIVNGTLEKVQWFDGKTQFVVDGQAYSSGDVKSLRADNTITEIVEETAN